MKYNFPTGCNSTFVFEIIVGDEYYATLMTPKMPTTEELLKSAYCRYPGLKHIREFEIYKISEKWKKRVY